MKAGIYKSTMILTSGRCSAICQRARSFRVVLKKWQLLCTVRAPYKARWEERELEIARFLAIWDACVSILLSLVKLELSARYVGVK